jgi:hypothetical protein
MLGMPAVTVGPAVVGACDLLALGVGEVGAALGHPG